PGSPALLLVSGGTTGMPKLIPRTHDDYVFNATASAALCRLSADDVYLVVLAAGHNFPLACPGLLGAMTVGATAVF
ncbi:AMP-binding protein, partial [Mycolicibacterium smegmatis]